jgi:hypothetical protein
VQPNSRPLPAHPAGPLAEQRHAIDRMIRFGLLDPAFQPVFSVVD